VPRESLTGKFRDSYTALINDLVIPGSKEKKITAVATVPAAASVSASQNHAVALVFVNQTIIIGSDAPST
jgi:Mce-associated membrane protein